MNPDMNVPPASNPGTQPNPNATMPPPQPAPTPVDVPQAITPPMPQPEAATPGQQPAPYEMPQAPQPEAAPPAPAPQPMFPPIAPSTSEQPMPGQPYPSQPAAGGFTPMAASQMPKPRGKKKLFIIAGVVLGLIVIGVAIFLITSKAALIGSLSSDTYEGLTYQRPTNWEKDTSGTGTVGYHPKTTLGKGSDGKPTYTLKMNVSFQKDIFPSAPNDLSASDKATLQDIIDQEISDASSDLLPNKFEVGCDTSPVYLDKPKKMDVKNSFLAVKYSFTCKSGTGSSETTFYYTVVDVIPNNKNNEFIIDIGAASKSIYDSNKTKIDNILSSVSF